MRTKLYIYLFIALTFVIIILTFLSIYLKSNRLIVTENTKNLEKYITAYTNKIISKRSSIQIEFTSLFMNSVNNKVDLKNVLKIYPGIKGDIYWLNKNTLEFNPYESFKSNSVYTIKLLLNKLSKIRLDQDFFTFEVQTIKQNFEVETFGLKSSNKKSLKWQKLSGSIQFADFIDIENVRKIISLEAKGKKLIPVITKDNANKYFFVIDSIPRLNTAYTAVLTINGNKIGIDKLKEINIEIPALGEFKFISATIIHQPEQYIQIQFSDPLEVDQLLSGLIRIPGISDLKFNIQDNTINVYLPKRVKGEKELIIEDGIKNILGFPIKQQIIKKLFFEAFKPAVRYVKSGVLLPVSDGEIVLPFEAVNLKAVDVQIIKIYESNITQFFQENNYDGDYYLKRVGRPIVQKTISLKKPGIVDFGNWNRFSINLNELIEADPGAIYNISIGFRKKHSLFNCNNQEIDNATLSEEDDEHWKTFDNYWYGEYSWEFENDPCHESYYGSRRMITKNILVTNIAVTAKKQKNDSLQVIVNDIITTNPVLNANVTAYNYQQQKIYTGITNKKGIVNFSSKDVYIIVASHNNQKTYLKINNASALSLSNFDVSGVKVEKGIKGYMFGERGVWRPGDSIFVSFLLQENADKLPVGHPIVFKLYNPAKQVVQKIIKYKNETNFYVFKTATLPEDKTGIYTAKIWVGGTEFRKNLRVEAIRPNRLKINLSMKPELIQNGEKIRALVNVKWLHGTPAKNLNTKIEYKLKPVKTDFSHYKGFLFTDYTKSFHHNKQLFFEGSTDSEGNIEIEKKIETGEEAPGKLNAFFTTRVFEKGGEYSINQAIFEYNPYESYLGIKLDDIVNENQMLMTDTNHIVRFVIVDSKGNLLKTNNTINIKMYKLTWRWWWDNSYDDIANYSGRIYQKPIKEVEIVSENGKANWNFRVNYPEWGRFLIKATDKVSGHSVSKVIYVDWPGWISRDNKNTPRGATMLSFTSDKKNYNVGEDINLTIPSSAGGRVLISIENGTKILKTYWAKTEKEQTIFSFKANEQMAPNIFVNISLLQPFNQTVNNLPIRLYGVLSLKIRDSQSILKPELIMPDELKAESNVTIEIAEKNKKAMTYCVAMVDEGLLDLTNFKTPDPWNYFYANEALGVKTWDVYDWVIGSYGSEIGKLLSIGGDDEVLEESSKKANRFKPVVRFLGPFQLKEGKINKHKIKLPSYIGSVRTMVIAKNNNSYGVVDKSTPVKKPLMVLASLPRVLGTQEIVKMQVDLFALSDKIKKADVTIQFNELLSPVDNSKKTVFFKTQGEKSIYFNLTTNTLTGVAKIEVNVKSGKEEAHTYIELDVRNPSLPITNVITKVLEPNEKWQQTFSPVGIKGTNKGTLEVSSIPPLNLKKRLNYLIRYPFGCIEQTVSSVFPLLYIENLTDLNESELKYFDEKIIAAIQRISTFQHENGGFGYWPESQDIDEWCTSYSGNFLLAAREKGYSIPSGLLTKWLKYQQRKAQRWMDDGPHSQLIQAYRLYTLSLAGKPEISALNYLREKHNLKTDAKWRLAAAYKLAGKSNISEKLTENLSTKVQSYSENSFTYGSGLRDKALILETLTILNNKPLAFNMIADISKELSSNKWLSTQTLAYSLQAISKYYENYKPKEEIQFSYSINMGKKNTFSGFSEIFQTKIPMQFTLDKIFEITNESEQLLHVAIILEGIPEKGDKINLSNNLKIKVNYKLLDGTIINPASIKQGTDFISDVTVTYLGKKNFREQFAVQQVFPSGWEIFNSRLYGDNTENNVEYEDIRDDRVYTYFYLQKGQTINFTTLLNASFAGKFYLPAIYAEAMYDGTINARKHGLWVRVIE
ncbi:MAG: hypothetical protein GXO79_15385 [Chlorobi bacterium]|nr:hypothetical protein [Chlorobiota bacterium]